MTTVIAALLSQLDAQRAFATRLRAPPDGLDVEVKGVGHLRFPISASTAAELRGVARPAPFGWRDRTLLDDSVRSTWEIPGSRVKNLVGGTSATRRPRSHSARPIARTVRG